jgi:cytochrome c-type biogenesis protein CcmE
LIVIAAAIGLLISFLDLTTFETINMAKKNPNKFFHVAARVDTSKAFEYDPQKDPNFCRFTVVDTLGNSMQVVYRKEKIKDMEKVSRLVMSGKFTGEHFECKSIQLKCPSKYKEELDKSKKSSSSAKL